MNTVSIYASVFLRIFLPGHLARIIPCAILGILPINEAFSTDAPGSDRSWPEHGETASYDLEKWAIEAAVAFITDKGINDLYRGHGSIADGDAGGQIYLFTLYQTLHDVEFHFGNRVFTPQAEMQYTLGIVDENARSPFFDFNVTIALRWKEFPWNHLVHTTFATGVGLSYTQKTMAMDHQRHPGTDRSHLKFDWPLQLAFAHPRHRAHQLVIFNHHQSGGYIFDRGGVNSHGIGYRYAFGSPPRSSP